MKADRLNVEFPYYYKAFGSILASELELPELTACEPSEPDIKIINNKVPKRLGNINYSRQYMKFGNDFYLFSMPDVGSYYVHKDGYICVESAKATHPKTLRMYLYAFCIPAFLFFTQRLPLHGSSLDVNGQGILLTGKSGAGKSTLASYFLINGHPFVADDLTVVDFHNSNIPMLYSSTPHQKLCRDAIKRLGREKASDFSYKGLGARIKYAVNIPQYAERPVALKIIVELSSSDADTPSIRKVLGSEKMLLLLQNTYRGFMIKGFQLKPWHFQICHKLSEQITCYKIERPKVGYWEEELYQFIMKEI